MNQENNEADFDMEKIRALPEWKLEDHLQSVEMIAAFAKEMLADDIADEERLAFVKALALAKDPRPAPLKDHEVRELVNELRDTAVKFAGHGSLRERIASVVTTRLRFKPASQRK